MSSEQEVMALRAACFRRDERELYRLIAKSMADLHGDEKPVDIWRVRAIARVYASQLYGWEIEHG